MHARSSSYRWTQHATASVSSCTSPQPPVAQAVGCTCQVQQRYTTQNRQYVLFSVTRTGEAVNCCLSSDGGYPPACRLKVSHSSRGGSKKLELPGDNATPLGKGTGRYELPWRILLMCVGLLLQPMQLLAGTFPLLFTAFFCRSSEYLYYVKEHGGWRWARMCLPLVFLL